jgi:hypothetical protein
VKAGRGGLLALAPIVAALAASAPVAHAGTYDVFSCATDAGFFPNNAWHVQNNPADNASYVTKTTCGSPTDPLDTHLVTGSYPAGLTYAGLEFDAPSGTSIADYRLDVHHAWRNSNAETYVMTLAVPGGSLAYAGHIDGASAGNLGPSPVDRRLTITRAGSLPAVAANPIELTVSAGCDGASGCTLDGQADSQLFGARVTISDPSPPQLTALGAGSGLLAPGVRSGDEPITFSATDNVGIRRAELVDVTDPSNQTVAAATDFNTTPTVKDARCDYTRPRPCPNVTDQTISASPPIAGRRTLLLRVTDAAGNQTVSAPFVVSARGPVNGSGGGDGARLIAGFPGHARRGHRRVGVLRPSKTVGWGHSARVRGILRNAAGQPIADAQLHLLIRDLKLGSHYADRVTLDTGADGRFTFRITRGPSRRFRIAYRAYPGDVQLTAKSDITFNTKARITARAPHHVRSRGTARFRGRLVGHPLPPDGVTLELQAHQPGHGWRTVKTTRTRRGGAFSTRYRFNSPAGRFTFRMRLRPSDSYPYARGTSKPMRVRVG